MFYSSERFYKDVRNHYDRYERDAICSSCGTIIGEQVKYDMWADSGFIFNDEKDSYSYCPYCGHKFNKSR